MGDVHTTLMADLNELLRKWTTRYGVTPNLVQISGDSLTLQGYVVTYSQLNEVRELAERHGQRTAVRALDDPTTPPPLGYFVPLQHPLCVWKTPDFAKMTTQVVSGDMPMRGLTTVEASNNATLVQCDDLTLGWVPTDALTGLVETPTSPRHLQKDELIVSDPPTEELWNAVGPFMGIPYVLGGKSESGIDCSGLISRVFRKTFGVVLPRHSTDQMRCGVRVSMNDVRSGDLVFARLRQNDIAHVALVLQPPGLGLKYVHASQTRGKVVCEDAREFFQDYRFMAARRLWKPKNS